MADQTQAPAPVASRITIDDVRTALEGIDPNSTNASKVRALLGGRGSFETIQKHLNTLRAEMAAAAAPPVAADQVPPLPADVAAAMWLAAYSAAQVATLRRAETLAAERDAALLKLETMGQDLAGYVETVDAQAAELDRAAATVAAVQAEHLADIEKAKAAAEAAAADRAQVAGELDHTRLKLSAAEADAQHAAELAKVSRESLSQELARLTDQIGELKAALYKRADAAPAV